jgi:hypothetical protein
MTTTAAISRPRATRSLQKVHATRKPNGAKAAPDLPMPRALLDAAPSADVVTIPPRRVLAIEGAGAPEGELFQTAVGALYGVAYTLKFARKKTGGADFKIGPLEGRWWAALEGTAFLIAPRDTWRWRLRIAMPDDVTKTEVAEAIAAATRKKGGKLEGSAAAETVRLERIAAQKVGRALHVGPYAEEGRTFDAIEKALAAAGVKPAFSHVEIYLGDPRRTPPARLRTVLLRETR